MSAYLLVYDIPAASEIPNPSAYLRGFAIRINLSCWIVQEADIPYAYLHEIASLGAVWRAVKFDPSEAANLIELATQSLRSEIAEMRNNTRRSCERASATMELGETESSLKAIQKQRGTVAQRLNNLRKNLNKLKGAAARFGISADVVGLPGAMAYVSQLHGVMNRRAEAFARATNIIEREHGSGTANAVRAGQVPAFAMADMVQDAGGTEADTVAENLRNIFRGVSGSGL